MDTSCTFGVNKRTSRSILGGLLLLGAAVAAAEESPGDSLLPDFYDDSTLSASAVALEDYESSSVDYFSGGVSRQATDVRLPGNGGFDITVTRSYRSQQPYKLPEPTTLGVGWNLHFGWLEITDINKLCSPLWSVSVMDNPVLHLPDGSTDVLAMTDLPMLDPTVPHYRGKSGFGLICGVMPVGSNTLGDFVLVDDQGRRYEMERWSDGGALYGFDRTAKWFVKQVTDRHGNWLWIDYARVGSDSQQLVGPAQVTASDGRVLDFSYNAATLAGISHAGQVLVEYAYEPSRSGAGFMDLVRVVHREELVWRYAYTDKASAGAGSLAEVTNPFGGTTRYTWQEVHFQPGPLDETEANAAVASVIQDAIGSPAATWTYAFTPATSPGHLDVTVVNAPEGVYTYRHFGAAGMRSDVVWMVGLKSTVKFQPADGGLERNETFYWLNYCISPENYKRTRMTGVWAAVDDAYYGAIITQHDVRIGNALWQTSYEDWDWGTHYLGTPRAQTVKYFGPGSDMRKLNRRYLHLPERNLFFLVTQEFYDQAAHPGYTPQHTDYDASGNPVRRFDRGYYEFLDWDGEGNLAASTRGLSGDRQQGTPVITSFRQYRRGVATEVVHPDGTVSRKEVDDFGRTRVAIDREGIRTDYDYDGVGRVTRIDPPLGNDTQVDYAGSRTTLERGNYRKMTRTDGLGRVLEETHGDTATGREMRILRDYDARGQVVFTSYPGSLSEGLRYAYDSQGRVVRVSHPGGERHIRYLDEFARTEVTDENGEVTYTLREEFGAPGQGELAEILSPEGVVTRITRNEYGLPLSISQGDNTQMLTRTNTYNASLVLQRSHDPETGDRDFRYDYAGNLVAVLRTDGVQGTVDHLYHQYDLNGRLLTTWAPTNEALFPGGRRRVLDVRLEYTWTPEGRPLDQVRHEYVGDWFNTTVVSQQYRSSAWRHEYDANGNTTRESVIVNGAAREFAYTWDANDRLRELVYPDGVRVAYEPDAFGWPTRAGNFATEVSYHETGQLAGFTYGNGRGMSLELNERFLLAGIQVPGVVELDYTYDAAGNVVSIADDINPGDSATLAYDGMNRLVTANGGWGAGAFAYDSLGNITRKDIGSDQLVLGYDNWNRLVSVAGTRTHQYTYDGFGNISGRDDGHFGYDGLGNLMLVLDAAGTTQAGYQYDARGRRIATMKNGSMEYHLQANGDRLLWEFETQDDTWKRNVYVGNIQVAREESWIACHDDIDGDGIPHCTETDAGLDPRDGSDALGDLDHDGLNNLQEFQRGTAIDDADTDDDGMGDGIEVSFGLNPRVNDAEADLDGDGIPNIVELARGGSPADPSEGQRDTDGDGLLDGAEYVQGTNWQDADSDDDGMGDGAEVQAGLDPRVNDAELDLDGDGMPNGWELAHNLQPDDAADASLDPDNDGVSSLDEYRRNSDPQVADVVPVVEHVLATAGGDFNFLSWVASPHARDYIVDHGVLGSAAVQSSSVLLQPWFEHAAVQQGALYWYSVRARNALGESSGPRAVVMPGLRQQFATGATLATVRGNVGLPAKVAMAGGDTAFLATFDHELDMLHLATTRKGQVTTQSVNAQVSWNLWDLVASESGDALLTWGNYVQYQQVTYFAMRYSPATGTWGPVETLATLPAKRDGFLRAQADEYGNFRVAYANRMVIENYYTGGYPLESFTLYMASASRQQPWNTRQIYSGSDALPQNLRFGSIDTLVLHEHRNRTGNVWTPEDRLHLMRNTGSSWSRWHFATHPDVLRVDFDRNLLAWSVRSGSSGPVYAARLCGDTCLMGNATPFVTPTIADSNSTSGYAPAVFDGQGTGQVYWVSAGALMYVKGSTDRNGNFVWGKPATLVDAARFNASGHYFSRERSRATWLWGYGELGSAEILPGGAWAVAMPTAGVGVAAVDMDVTGNLVFAGRTSDRYTLYERRSLASSGGHLLDTVPPVVSQQTVRSGKSTIQHVVTLGADKPANIYFRVSGGSIKAGGSNTTAEQRYTGPVTLTFPKGSSATITWRGISMAERWSTTSSVVLQ